MCVPIARLTLGVPSQSSLGEPSQSSLGEPSQSSKGKFEITGSNQILEFIFT